MNNNTLFNNNHLHKKDNITNLSMIDIINEKIILINNFNNMTNLSNTNKIFINKLIDTELIYIANILGENSINYSKYITQKVDENIQYCDFDKHMKDFDMINSYMKNEYK